MTPEFEALKSALEREHLAQQESREAVYDLPTEERVASGTALDKVYYQGTEGASSEAIFVFRCEQNSSRFRPGTRLRLSREDPRRPLARLELVDDRFDGKKYILRLAGALEERAALESAEPWVLDEDVFDLLDTQLSILDAAQESGLGSWLAGEEDVPRPAPAPTGSRFVEGLDGSLKTAFETAVASREYFAVQGPPGSGKTHLLARLALYYALEENKRVLLTAVSHQAIHNALGETHWVGRRLAMGHPLAPELLSDGFYKLGSSRGNNEGLPEGVHASLRVSHHKRPLIAGATLYAALHPAWGFSRRPFDVILFDEAGQAPIVLALAARLLARKVVFIGDDAQMPPVRASAADEDSSSLARMSALGFLRANYDPPFMLTETRRLNAELCALVSASFYGGALSPTVEAAERRLRLKKAPGTQFAEILDAGRALIFLDVPHQRRRSTSEEEARWAAAIASEAVNCGLAPGDVGVIAPYRAQANAIRFLLGKRCAVLCATVERFQGQERELIVISLTSSQKSYLARLAGFLFDPNRLNVAVSRARTKVVVIGSKAALLEAAQEGGEVDPDAPQAAGFAGFRNILAAAHIVDGSRPPKELAPMFAGVEADAEGEAFKVGDVIEHPQYGPGRVLAQSVELIDNRRRWANEIRFEDGKVRLIVPSLTSPPMRAVE